MAIQHVWRGDSPSFVLYWSRTMNSGKTLGLRHAMEDLRHRQRNVRVYGPALNNRDKKDCIVVNDELEYPAKTVPDVHAIKDDLESLVEQVNSSARRFAGENGKITINGVDFYKGRGVTAVGVDELQFFVLTPEAALEFVKFVDWCKGRGISVFAAGLLYDFRVREFGHMQYVFKFVDDQHESFANCKCFVNGEQCQRQAQFSQKVWHVDRVPEDLRDGFLDLPFFDFVDKQGQVVQGQYVPAPFLSQTVEVDAPPGRPALATYLPVCHGHFSLPFERETMALYDRLVVSGGACVPELTDPFARHALDFFRAEGWVDKNGVAVPAYVHPVGRPVRRCAGSSAPEYLPQEVMAAVFSGAPKTL